VARFDLRSWSAWAGRRSRQKSGEANIVGKLLERCWSRRTTAPIQAVNAAGGWPAPFVERIRRAEYPQYIWDQLPLQGGTESILRLDHLFPIGADPAAYRLENHRLSDEALVLLDEWVTWLLTDGLPSDGTLAMIRTEFSKL